MTRIDLSNRVAIVTGAGRGLGRAYAEALTERGARVVVNDLGTDGEGSGSDPAIAQSVVDEIISKGGKAVADNSDITDTAMSRAIVERAIETFGDIDIVINNAGICGNQAFTDTSLADFERYWRIHVAGSINLIQAAWPHLVSKNYGRVVLTESGAGLYGLRGQSAYSAAKGAVHGLMRTLAIEGRDHGILVNAVSPGGFSRMHEAAIDDPDMLDWTRRSMPPELVAPALVWLASDACRVSGEVYSVWSGRMARVGIGTGAGLYDRSLTPEAIRDHYSEVADTIPLYEAADSLDEIAAWLDGRIGGKPER